MDIIRLLECLYNLLSVDSKAGFELNFKTLYGYENDSSHYPYLTDVIWYTDSFKNKYRYSVN